MYTPKQKLRDTSPCQLVCACVIRWAVWSSKKELIVVWLLSDDLLCFKGTRVINCGSDVRS